jgi:low affinity Fe/Cu permease
MDLTQLINIASSAGVAVVLAIYFSYWITNHLSQKMDKIVEKLDEILREQREFYRIVIEELRKRAS